MADKSADKQELRRKLASMKKDYARTLRSVEKSEKAKRARSHVQRKLAEQAQLSSTSPSCTHTFRKRIDPKTDTSTDEPSQDEKTKSGGDESLNERDLKSLMATRRRQRQRRSVSFMIPEEAPSERDFHDSGAVEKRGGHLGASVIKRQDEQLESKSKRPSLPELSFETNLGQSNGVKMSFVSKALSVNDTGDSKLRTHTGRKDRTTCRSEENVVLVVPESQFTESLLGSVHERDDTPETLGVSHPKENAGIKAEHKQNLDLPSGKFDNGTTKSSSISPLQELAHSNSNNNNSNNTSKVEEKIGAAETALNLPHHVEVKKRRAGRHSRMRSRKPRELTASDISMKEVVHAQCSEEGSHTWIEGLMYPVEYYVRRTRSMTSSQSSQSQNYPSSQRCMDKNESQRDTDTQLSTTEQKGSLTDSAGSKDSPVPHATTVKAACMNQLEANRNQQKVSQRQVESSRDLTEGNRNLTESSRNLTEAPNLPSESDSDSLRSQLSESLLKTSLPRPQDSLAGKKRDNDKMILSRQTKTRQLQRRRVIWKGSPRVSLLIKNCTDDKMTGEDGACTPNPEDSKSNSGHTSSVQESQSSSVSPDLCSASATDVSTPDLRSNPGTEDGGPAKSQPEHDAGSILPSLRNLKLPHSDFMLPDEEFGTLKKAKLKTLKCLPEAGEAARLKCNDRDKNIPPSLPLEKENVVANTDKSQHSDESIPAENHHKNSNDQLVSGLSHTTSTQDQVTFHVTHNSPFQKPHQSDRNIATNSPTEVAPPFPEAPRLKQTRINQQEDIDSVQPSLHPGSPARSCNSGKIQPGRVPIKESPVNNILHSQFSLTQFHDSGSLAFPSAGCTPGFSPSCSMDDTDGVMLTKKVLRSSQEADLEASLVKGEDLGDGDHKVDFCLDSKLEVVDRSSLSRPSVTSTCDPTKPISRSNLQQHTVFVYPPPSNQTTALKDGLTLCSNLSRAVSHETSAGNQLAGDQPTNDITGGTTNGSITPPTVHPEASRAVSSNINQISPFAGGATGSPFGRAEEPEAMSQCEVEVLSEDNEEEERGVTRHDLSLSGCLQLDLPWELSPTVRDIASGVVNIDGETSILVLAYQHSLVIWQYYDGTQEWAILQSWALPQDKEFSLVECLPCSKRNEVSLVVAGKFASCSVRILTFDTLTRELQKLDVNLSQSLEDQVPYLLCTISEQDFIVAVKDTKNNTTVFSGQASMESSTVHVVKLATGCDGELTSLLQVKDAEGIVMATTSNNHILLWCLKTGEMIKDVPIKSVASGSCVSCLEAVAESGLLFLILVYRDDVGDLKARCKSCIGAIMAFNPNTDRMFKLTDYRLPSQHENASLVDGVIHNDTLLAKLSDGSLHQWEIFTGNLLNYSSGNPTNQGLRNAKLCNTQVLLFGTDQYLQIYDEYL